VRRQGSERGDHLGQPEDRCQGEQEDRTARRSVFNPFPHDGIMVQSNN
jgi:hypothetical protein